MGSDYDFFTAFHSVLRKQGSPCLLSDSLAYMFSGLLINVKRICAKIGSWLGNFSVYVPHGVMGSKILLMLFFFEENLIFFENVTLALN